MADDYIMELGEWICNNLAVEVEEDMPLIFSDEETQEKLTKVVMGGVL